MDQKQFTQQCGDAFKAAIRAASDAGHSQVTALHVMAEFANEARGILENVATKASSSGAEAPGKASSSSSGLYFRVKEGLTSALSKLPRVTGEGAGEVEPSPSAGLIKAVRLAAKQAESLGDEYITTDVLLSQLLVDPQVKRAIGDAEAASLGKAAASLREGKKATSRDEATLDALKTYGVDVTEQARAGELDPVVGRDDELRRVIRILARRRKNNVVLVGEAGVGKTAIVEGLAQRIVNGDVPRALLDCRIISVDSATLLAGASYKGQFEERVRSIISECEANPGIILFIDELHTIMAGKDSGGGLDAGNILKPSLARGKLRMIGATTTAEYRIIEKDAALERRFQGVMVGEPSVESTVSILRGLKPTYESYHGITIQDAALVAAAKLSDRYVNGRFLPDKAIDLVDEACAATRVQLDSQPEKIEALERQILQLEIEATAMASEKDTASKDRLKEVRVKLSELREELAPLRAAFEAQRSRVEELRRVRRQIAECLKKAEAAERDGDLALVADLRYGAVPDLQQRLARLEQEEAERADSEMYSPIGSPAEDDRRPAKRPRPTVTGVTTSEVVTPEAIAQVVSRWTGIPVSKLTLSEREKLLHLASHIERRVVGQDAAVRAVADAVVRSRAGMSRPGKPSSFLFVGSTGTGKTELARALAAEVYGEDKAMIRLDMSEYSEKHSVARLVGSPPGYVGFEEGGQLTEAIRKRPHSLLLLDEIEKAHPVVLNTLLQLLDEGRLTDGQGKVVDASNCIVIMTSNLGAMHLLSWIEGDPRGGEDIPMGVEEAVLGEVRAHLSPELRNRLDDIILFRPLGKPQLRSVLRREVEELSARLAEQQGGANLSITDAACDALIDDAWSPAYGARPLRRHLERRLGTEVSRLLLAGKVPMGATIVVDSTRGRVAASSSSRATAGMGTRDSTAELHLTVVPKL
jgi:ATP-dependent Clp protease ATP-binding subunit ClpB